MLKRTITSLILISIAIITVFLLPIWAFSIMASIFICLALYEFFKLDPENIFPRSFVFLGILSGMMLPYIVYFSRTADFYRDTGIIGEALFFISVLILLFLIQFTRKESKNAVTFIALTLFGIFYVGWFFTFLVKIRFLEDGHKLVLYLLLVTKAGDIGAYLIGSKFGRHALIPRLSPNK